MKKLIRRVGLTLSAFGRVEQYQIPADEKDDCVILCVNEGYGWRPVRFLLLHQIYESKIAEIAKQYPNAAEIAAFPVRADNYTVLASVAGTTAEAA